MEITSEVIKKLRDKTGAGMMDCKRALEATGGRHGSRDRVPPQEGGRGRGRSAPTAPPRKG